MIVTLISTILDFCIKIESNVTCFPFRDNGQKTSFGISLEEIFF